MKSFIQKSLTISSFLILVAISVGYAGGEGNPDDWNKWTHDSPCGPVDIGNGEIICVAPYRLQACLDRCKDGPVTVSLSQTKTINDSDDLPGLMTQRD